MTRIRRRKIRKIKQALASFSLIALVGSIIWVLSGICDTSLNAKNEAFRAETCKAYKVIDQTEKSSEKAVFERSTGIVEQYSKETTETEPEIIVCETLPVRVGAKEATEQSTEPQSPVYVYTICGKSLGVGLSAWLYECLDEQGIAWWYEYAVCQAFAESGFNSSAVSADGKDFGLFQFRAMYWSEYCHRTGIYGDILDPYTQISVYARKTADLLAQGISVDEVISAHYTGGGAVNNRYVGHVIQWLSKMR